MGRLGLVAYSFALTDNEPNICNRRLADEVVRIVKKEFVPFSINIEFNKPATERGWVVFEKDNPSGLPENADSLKIPVAFGTTKETSSVKVYFSSNALNPGAEDCSKVFPIERTIPKTEAIARAALEELLKGPTNKEAEREYFFQ